jgi:Copper amine oxidase N-terminal domain.
VYYENTLNYEKIEFHSDGRYRRISYFGGTQLSAGTYSKHGKLILTQNGLPWLLEEGILYQIVYIKSPLTPAQIRNSPTIIDNSIAVYLNEKKLQFDVAPKIVDGRTFVPMRTIFESLGATVEWKNESQEVIAIRRGKIVILKIGSNKAMIDGTEVEMDSTPFIEQGRTLIPLRFISEAFDCVVNWDSSARTIRINY